MPRHKLALAASIFTGAFLLFQVQPLTGKIILPWFGGSSAVWSTCLLFFQSMLFLGYVYAHFLVRVLRPARQAIVHSSLLALSLFCLPINLHAAPESEAYLGVLRILFTSVGLPYFFLASAGPLIQSWYAQTNLGTPYRLFSLSNLASLLGLLAYPFLVEPFSSTGTQTRVWSWGYAITVALTIAAAIPIWNQPERPQPEKPVPAEAIPVPWWSRVMWFLLPACASALLVGVTTHLTQNVAPIPLLWIVPLALYLASFIVCFDHEAWYDPELFRMMLAAALLALTVGVLRATSVPDPRLLLAWFSVAFFLCCMFCHGELARLKPASGSLTSFYLTLSFGGACGGVFSSLAAPLVFSAYEEVPLTLVFTAILATLLFRREGNSFWKFWAGFTIALAILHVNGAYETAQVATKSSRNFYGVLRVVDDPQARARLLMHGTVNHGEQFLDPARSKQPTTYYAPNSGAGLALLKGCPAGACKVGLIGLGAGTLAAYSRPNDHYRFYEINPAVIEIARHNFTFLSQASGRIDVVTGDARLSLEKELAQKYDVLLVDAFSGDSVPVHLLTSEAAKLYLSHLQANGILALHVSNNFLNLPPLVAAIFKESGKQVRLVQNPPQPENRTLFSEWVLVTSNQTLLEDPQITPALQNIPMRPSIRTWTDDYSNLLQLLR